MSTTKPFFLKCVIAFLIAVCIWNSLILLIIFNISFPLADMITDDGDFFISSSSRVLDWCGAEDDGDSEFFPGRDSLLDFSPIASDLTPLNLGELRHTKDSLRLELPLLARAHQVAGDHANLTSDSGIDTSSPKPAPPSSSPSQQVLSPQQAQMSCAQQSAREDKGEAALLDEQPMLPPSNK